MSAPRLLSACFSGGVARRSAIVACIVGPILTAINQGDALIAGEALNWTKVFLTFLVPYIVSTIGAVGVLRAGTLASGTPGDSGPCQPKTAELSSAQESPIPRGDRPLKARVHVMLKAGVLDPQGKAIENALSSLGFAGIENVRQGKVIELTLPERDPQKARQSVESMCEKLLANTVIENYAIELEA